MPTKLKSLLAERRSAPTGPRLDRPDGGAGVPWLLTGAALLMGVALARAIAWRGHAHPRR